MKLSILIPMHNAQDNIANCLYSLTNQNLPQKDYEIIIMDDGSNDNSVAIVEDYMDKYPNITLHKTLNSGCYSTRNKLLKLAKGDYIYNIDSDDYIVSNCLAELLFTAVSHDADILGFKTNETTNLKEHNLKRKIENTDFEVNSGEEFIEKYKRLRHEIWWYFLKRDYLEKQNFTFSSNEYNADVVFTITALLRAKKVVFLPIAIHRYVQTENSLMRSKDFSIVSKRLMYMQMMIINKSRLINKINNKDKKVLIDNLTHRRDVFVLFNITNMVRNPFSLIHVKNKIEMFEQVGAYPLKNVIERGEAYSSFLHRILVFLVNRKYILFAIIKLKNIFSKSTEFSHSNPHYKT